MKTNNCLKKMRPVCSCLNKLSHLYFMEQYKSRQFIRLLQPIIQHFKFEVMPIELDGYNSFCWSIFVQSLFKCPPSLMPHCPTHRPKCTMVISDGTLLFFHCKNPNNSSSPISSSIPNSISVFKIISLSHYIVQLLYLRAL